MSSGLSTPTPETAEDRQARLETARKDQRDRLEASVKRAFIAGGGTEQEFERAKPDLIATHLANETGKHLKQEQDNARNQGRNQY